MRTTINNIAGPSVLHVLLPLVVSLLAGCVSGESGDKQGPGAVYGGDVGPAKTYVYECPGGQEFTVRVKDRVAWLFLPAGTKGLARIASASGAKFGDGETSYWGKGDEAQLEVDGRVYRHCRNNRSRAIWEDAKLRGVDFRAVGNEPGWHLEIGESRKAVFVHNYGQGRYDLAITGVSTDNASRITRYELHDRVHRLTVKLEGRRCSDTMSDERYETTVTLWFDGQRLSGCGRALH